MFRNLKAVLFVLFVAVVSTGMMVSLSHAAAKDYRFELVDKTIHAGQKVPITIRLVQTKTGKDVTNADLEEPKLIMKMKGMADMPGHAAKMAPDGKGNYRVAADVVAPGEWVLELTAKVPGEKEPVKGSLNFQVVK